MELYSLSFLFLFLPVTLLLYYAVPCKARNGVLLGASLVFYALLQPLWLLVMVVSIITDYGIARQINHWGREHKRSSLLMKIVVAKALALIVLVSAANQVYGSSMPLGIFIYLLTSLGYLIDFYKGEAPFEPSFINFAVFCCFFGKLYAGPLVEYHEVSAQLASPKASLSGLGRGLSIFIRGLAKKVLVADSVTAVYLVLKEMPPPQLTLAGTWALVFCSAFSVYFTLSALCDMARGLGFCFGMNLPLNFYYPFEARTVYDFFSRFNTTVSRFIRKHVYLGLGSDQNGRLATSLNILLTAMLMGLWFGLRINFLAWGTCLGLLLIAESLWLKPLLEKIPPFFVRVLTFAATLLSFSIFSAEDIMASWDYIQNLLGLRAGQRLINDELLYLFSSQYTILALCFVLSTSLMTKAGKGLARRYPRLSAVTGAVMHMGLLTVTIAFML